MLDRLAAVNLLATRTKEILLPFSGGKDSLALLSICHDRFERIVLFAYQVMEFSFTSATRDFVKRRRKYASPHQTRAAGDRGSLRFGDEGVSE